MLGYLGQDGRKGIRNVIVVAYLVECAHHVAREIVYPYRDRGVHLIGFSGCFPNAYAHRMMDNLCTHANVGGVLLLSLGCEGFSGTRSPNGLLMMRRPMVGCVARNVRRTLSKGRAR